MMKPREPRRTVLIPSRMRVGATWVDVCIHNISSRGALVRADEAPVPGTYVDIRRGSQVVIGRAVWRKGHFFGIRTQDRIDVDAFVNEPRRAGPPPARAAAGERRATSRFAADAAMARRVERSRAAASAMQFGLLALAGGGGAIVAAVAVHDVLAAPLTAIESALSRDG